MTLRIAVTGQTGQVAMSLKERAIDQGSAQIVTVARPYLDLERPQTIEPALRALRPDVIVNAAAFTFVDKAEAEPERAFAINRDGAAGVARAAQRLGVPLIHLSTDYVFRGDKGLPYVEADVAAPVNAYGHSKLAGETAVIAAHPRSIVLRTSWVFSTHGSNFLKTMLRMGAERPKLRIVRDQLGNPTAASDIADAILRIAPVLTRADQAGGVYHYCGQGSTSWYDFAEFIFAQCAEQGGPQPVLEPIATADYPTPARRPLDTRLDTSAFSQRFGFEPSDWKTAAGMVIAALQARNHG